jgi:ethanolamine utilization protein EutQ
LKRLITEEDVEAEAARGKKELAAPRGQTIVTPAAWSRAQELGVHIALDAAAAKEPATPAALPGAAREVDASGVVVVRGRSVQLARFEEAGATKNVQLKDVITAKDRSPMGAGFMAWSRDDSFSWELTYDEIDYVLEGVLHITIDGRTVEGRAGDVLYIPKGSKIVFGTPNRVKVFYVTHPANWSGGA